MSDAARARTIPYPKRGSWGSACPAPGAAVPARAALIAATPAYVPAPARAGWASRRRATIPATNAADVDVPPPSREGACGRRRPAREPVRPGPARGQEVDPGGDELRLSVRVHPARGESHRAATGPTPHGGPGAHAQ